MDIFTDPKNQKHADMVSRTELIYAPSLSLVSGKNMILRLQVVELADLSNWKRANTLGTRRKSQPRDERP